MNKRTHRVMVRTTLLRYFILFPFALAIVGAANIFAATGQSEISAGSNRVFARVGNHEVTEQEVDSTIRLQLYNLRKQAIDQVVANYLIEDAAKKDNLTVAAYLKREVDDKVAAEVTDAKVKQFYDQNKDKIPALKASPYDKIKGRLTQVLRQHDTTVQLGKLIETLRANSDVKMLLEPPRFDVASNGHPALGPENAPVTIVEFGDFQCPYCKGAESTLKSVRQKYGDQVRLVFMDYPLSFHAHAQDAANAALCAGDQDKFWQYHDALFADQSKLSSDGLMATAKKLGLNMDKFDACFKDNKYKAVIAQDIAEGNRLNVRGTPTFFIDGRPLVGASMAGFEGVIDPELASSNKPGTKTASR